MAKTIWECQCRSVDGPSHAMCRQPAPWLATHRNGVVTLFCDECKEHAWERRNVVLWHGPTEARA
jgi:hypothetical protein